MPTATSTCRVDRVWVCASIQTCLGRIDPATAFQRSLRVATATQERTRATLYQRIHSTEREPMTKRHNPYDHPADTGCAAAFTATAANTAPALRSRLPKACTATARSGLKLLFANGPRSRNGPQCDAISVSRTRVSRGVGIQLARENVLFAGAQVEALYEQSLRTHWPTPATC